MALVAIATPITLAAAPANANVGSPKCMSKTEWSQIKVGQSRTKVTQIVGNAGRVTWSSIDGDGWSKDIDVDFRQCKANGQPAATYSTIYMAFSNYDYDYPSNTWHPMSLSYKGSWHTAY